VDSKEKVKGLDMLATAGMAAVLVGAGLWHVVAVGMVRNIVVAMLMVMMQF
jgi:hypothetical protein